MRVGVDEAGKGPVLGSMFAAAVRADPEDLPAGVGDSKGVPAQRRERLAVEVRAAAESVAVAEIPVDRVDDPETDMNELTVAAHAEALADAATPDDHALVDAGDPDARRFERRVEGCAPPTVQAEHGADETYAIVGAASIIAKSAREAHVTDLTAAYGAVGSGYPSDPTTRSFLRSYVDEHGSLPACARETWQTSRDVLAARDQASLEEF